MISLWTPSLQEETNLSINSERIVSNPPPPHPPFLATTEVLFSQSCGARPPASAAKLAGLNRALNPKPWSLSSLIQDLLLQGLQPLRDPAGPGKSSKPGTRTAARLVAAALAVHFMFFPMLS